MMSATDCHHPGGTPALAAEGEGEGEGYGDVLSSILDLNMKVARQVQ